MSFSTPAQIDLTSGTVGSSYTALPSGQSYGSVTQVLLTNNSGFVFNVTSSSDGELPQLQAFSNAVYNAPANGGSLTVTIASGNPNAIDANLQPQYAIGDSTFTGISPALVPVGVNTSVVRETADPQVDGDTVGFTFPAIASGLAANVTVSVPTSPAAPTWTVETVKPPAAGVAVGVMVGANSLANIYLEAGEQIYMSATDSSLSGFSGDAIEVGVQGDPSVVTPGVPAPSSNDISIGNEVQLAAGATVTISGTPDVNVTGGTIDIGNTPAVTVSSGTIDIGSGTVDVGNTPSVTLSGSDNTVQISGTPAVTVDSGSVDITGDVTLASDQTINVNINDGQSVEISGTPAVTLSGSDNSVSIANTPTVEISGTVETTISSGTVSISGTPTVEIASDQVVQVTNEPDGSLTVAGTVEISTGTVTVSELEAGSVDITALPQSTLLDTIPSGSSSYAITISDSPAYNSLVILGEAADMANVLRVVNSNAVVPWGRVPINTNDGPTYGVYVDLPAADTYTIYFNSATAEDVYVYASTGLEVSATFVANLPLIEADQAYSAAVESVLAGSSALVVAAVGLGTGGSTSTFAGSCGAFVINMGSSDYGNTPPTVTATYALGSGTPTVGVQLSMLAPSSGSNAALWYGIVPGGCTSIDISSYTGAALYWLSAPLGPWPKVPVQSVSVTEPAAGADWSYTLPFAAKVTMVQAVLSTSSQSATRDVRYEISSSAAFSVTPSGITASTAAFYNAYLGGPMPPVETGGSNIYERSLPDLGVLPAGTTIKSSTVGLQTEDQWEQITLWLQPA